MPNYLLEDMFMDITGTNFAALGTLATK